MTAEENKAVIRRLLEVAWNRNQPEVVDECLAETAVLHQPSGPGAVPFGPAAQKQVIAAWLAAFPDLRHGIEDLLADGDKVIANAPLVGTHEGILNLGADVIQPTGKSIRVREFLICRVAGSKIVELWATFDRLAVLELLQADRERRDSAHRVRRVLPGRTHFRGGAKVGHRAGRSLVAKGGARPVAGKADCLT